MGHCKLGRVRASTRRVCPHPPTVTLWFAFWWQNITWPCKALAALPGRLPAGGCCSWKMSAGRPSLPCPPSVFSHLRIWLHLPFRPLWLFLFVSFFISPIPTTKTTYPGGHRLSVELQSLSWVVFGKFSLTKIIS